MALATVVWSPAAVSGATYSREYTMVGKLANVYQPFGLWYHDLTTERSLEVINHIADDVRKPFARSLNKKSVLSKMMKFQIFLRKKPKILNSFFQKKMFLTRFFQK